MTPPSTAAALPEMTNAHIQAMIAMKRIAPDDYALAQRMFDEILATISPLASREMVMVPRSELFAVRAIQDNMSHAAYVAHVTNCLTHWLTTSEESRG